MILEFFEGENEGGFELTSVTKVFNNVGKVKIITGSKLKKKFTLICSHKTSDSRNIKSDLYDHHHHFNYNP